MFIFREVVMMAAEEKFRLDLHVKATATFHAVAAKWLRQELVCPRKLTQQRVSGGVEPCRRGRRVELLVDERQL
jgi:hypothetical protein